MAKVETEEQKKAREVVEALAENILKLAESVRALLNGKVSKKAIVLLVASAAGKMPQETVEKVLDAAANLDKKFLK